jgi:hypothetical protein
MWWDFVIEFTGGDMSQLPELIRLAENEDAAGEKSIDNWTDISPYISKALEIYFDNHGINPFEGGNK